MKATTKSSKRALQRHYARRKCANAYRKLAGWRMQDEAELQSWTRKNYNHLTVCSCWMCGYYRKWEGMTMQERCSLLALKDER